MLLKKSLLSRDTRTGTKMLLNSIHRGHKRSSRQHSIMGFNQGTNRSREPAIKYRSTMASSYLRIPNSRDKDLKLARKGFLGEALT